MSNRISEFRAIPYTTSIGQTINPGDTILAVKSSRSFTNTDICIFKGVNVIQRNGREVIASISVLNKDARVWKYDSATGKGGYVTQDTVSTLTRKRIVKIDENNLDFAKSLTRYL